jgi:hypothetical protein
MAKLRTLFALTFVAAGAVLGGLALSGYYEPHTMLTARSQTNSAGVSGSGEGARLMRTQPRQRFVIADRKADAKVQAQAEPAPKVRPIKTSVSRDATSKSKPKDKRTPTQQVSAQWQWPWNLFGN